MKNIILFLFLAVQIGTAQETWNACNSTVSQIPAPSYDSTFVLEAPSRAALQKGMANWVPASSGGAASYLVYTALLTQTGTNAPTATVLENTLGGTVVWTYDSEGNYIGTLSGAFTVNKTFLSIPDSEYEDISSSRTSANAISVKSYTNGGYNSGDPINGRLTNYPIEIRVYP